MSSGGGGHHVLDSVFKCNQFGSVCRPQSMNADFIPRFFVFLWERGHYHFISLWFLYFNDFSLTCLLFCSCKSLSCLIVPEQMNVVPLCVIVTHWSKRFHDFFWIPGSWDDVRCMCSWLGPTTVSLGFLLDPFRTKQVMMLRCEAWVVRGTQNPPVSWFWSLWTEYCVQVHFPKWGSLTLTPFCFTD